MSAANLPYGGHDDGTFKHLAFLAASLVIHAALAWLVFSAGGTARLLLGRVIPKEPIYVEIIDLPPGQSTPGAQKEIRRYADRTNVVEKETFPEAPKAVIIPGRPSTGSAQKAPAKSPAARPRDNAKEAVQAPAIKSLAEPPLAGETEGLMALPPEDSAPSVKETAPSTGPAEPGGLTTPARPNLLLTEEKLTELTKQYEQESPRGEKGKTLQLNTTELKYQKYLINMKHRIEFYWEYPVLAIRNGWQGKLNLDFTIKKDGTIGEIILQKSSGYPALDDAARTALRLAAPFPPFPENFSIEEIHIKGQFEYDIQYAPPPPMR